MLKLSRLKKHEVLHKKHEVLPKRHARPRANNDRSLRRLKRQPRRNPKSYVALFM